MKKQRKMAVLLIALIVSIILGTSIILIQKNMPSKVQMKLSKYYPVLEGKVRIILQNELYDTMGLYKNGEVYVDMGLVNDKLNARFYWDPNENLLIYTTASQKITAPAGEKYIFIGNSRENVKNPVVYVSDGTAYVSLSYMKNYTALDYKVYNNPNRVVINYKYNKKLSYGKAKEDSFIRTREDIKSPWLVQMKKEEAIMLLGAENKDTGFIRVMTKSGIIGYLRSKDLESKFSKALTTDFKPEKYTHILRNHKINLVWHQVTSQSANNQLMTAVADMKGVNTIVPTWFSVSDNDGAISSIASDLYVSRAHNMGLEVWGLCSDFDKDVAIGRVLSRSSSRQRLEKNLIAEAIRYSLDGINIDFEKVRAANGKDFLQFIRELGIMCRNNGLVLSIDNYPPASYSQYYNRKEQAAVADYVITMAYDEYYAGSEEAGPVSSFSYVQNSVNAILKEVPKKQSIIGLPFYSRLWKESSAGLKSEAYSMKYAEQAFDGKKITWDDTRKMNYGEYSKDGTTYKMWIEDEKSLDLKMKVVKNAKMGGMAFWKLGLEKPSIWNLVEKYSK